MRGYTQKSVLRAVVYRLFVYYGKNIGGATKRSDIVTGVAFKVAWNERTKNEY